MFGLSFTLSMIDQVTRPLRAAGAGVKNFAKQSEDAFKNIAVGGAALYGTFKALEGGLNPAIQMQDAINSASAKGVSDAALTKMSASALLFSARYGTAATDFIKSTETMRYAINDLSDKEFPRVALASNTLGKALSDSATSASTYLGAMYNSYKNTADSMGRVKFIDNITGQTAYMAKSFGLNMQQIQDLVKSTKGAGNNFGVGQTEQFAVLGQLSRTMGTEAGGAYEQFLNNAVAGGKELGLSFTDTNGKLLAMPDIMAKVQQKFGKSLDGNLKAQAALDKAFGGGSLVVKSLYGNVDALSKHMTELGSNDGMRKATAMADKMTNPFERLQSMSFAVRAAIGGALLPVINPMIHKAADMGTQFAKWMKMFPNIARVVSYVAVGFLGFAAAGAAANIVMGITKFIMIGLRGIMVIFGAVLKVGRVFVWAYRAAIIAWNVALRILRATLLVIRVAAFLAGAGFMFMSWPILLVIAAIALLCVGVYYLIKYWDQIKAAIMDTAAFKIVAAYFQVWKTVFLYVVDVISEAWTNLCAWFGEISPFDSVADMANSLGNVFSGLWVFLKKSFSETYNWIVDKLNMIPGINIDLMPSDIVTPDINLLSGSNLKGVNSGGISKEISKSSSNQVDNSSTTNTFNVYPKEMMEPEKLMEFTEKYAG